MIVNNIKINEMNVNNIKIASNSILLNIIFHHAIYTMSKRLQNLKNEKEKEYS